MSLAALFEVVELLVMLLMVAFGKTKSSNLVKFANPKSNMANDIIAYPAVQF